jgi:serine carboxypeptidase 1
MNTVTAAALLAAMDRGQLSLNFKGIALGDSWISGVEYVNAWGPFLQATSLMDANQYTTLVLPSVKQCDSAAQSGDWADATNYWGDVENAVESTTDTVSFYNILVHNQNDDDPAAATVRADHPEQVYRALSKKDVRAEIDAVMHLAPAGVRADALASLYARHVKALGGPSLAELMNGPVRSMLGDTIPPSVTWGGQSGAVFSALSVDFMQPVYATVDSLLADGRLKVVVYNGQLDLICCTVGTSAWMSKLRWAGMGAFNQSPKTPFYPAANSQATSGFMKQHPTGNLTMFYILDAGHMVPADNPYGALAMLHTILSF